MIKYPSHSELCKYTDAQLQELCSHLRQDIIDTVAQQGGHLASSLGAVELCVALHKHFDLQGKDCVFFDVGHQAYAHKLLTGRQKSFYNLRDCKGCSGFPNPEESSADPVYAGHAGVAISQAIGATRALDLQHQEGYVIAVVGDGSLSCGLNWEALNNIKTASERLIVILNDNQMSISPNRGAIRSCLNKIISWRFYNQLRNSISNEQKYPLGKVRRLLRRIEHSIKAIFFSDGILFQEFGLRYFGPINGNSIKELNSTLLKLPTNKPVLLHIVTKKGNGFPPAEENPENFHGVNNFDKTTGQFAKTSDSISFSCAFAQSLCSLAKQHQDVIAVSAAMLNGTKLNMFAKQFPQRCFDTGIAEGHTVAFASGLAAKGLHPVVAMYSTFLQRALDNVYHDICLNNLPVIFCIDRTGAVPDGPTHHGLYALPYLLHLPNMTIMTPADAWELQAMLTFAYQLKKPVVIRYPRGNCPELQTEHRPLSRGKSVVVIEPEQTADLTIWSCGAELTRALSIAGLLKQARMQVRVVNARFLLPFDSELAQSFADKPQAIIDDYGPGGLLSCMQAALSDLPCHAPILPFTWPDNTILPHGNIEVLRNQYGLSVEQIAKKCLDFLKK